MIAAIFSLFGFFLLGFSILWFQRLVRRGHPLDRSVFTNAKSMSGWLIIFMTTLIFTGPFALIFIIGMVLNRIGERRSLLWTLAVSAEKQIPLSVAARSFAMDRQDDFGARAVAFADALDTGATLETALKRAHIRLPIAARLAIDIGGDHDGGLSRSLLSAAKQEADVSGLFAKLVDRSLYLLLTLAVLVQIITFVCIFIVPTFRMIFEDFDVDLPPVTEYMITAANYVASFSPIIMTLLVFLGMYVAYQFLRWAGLRLPRLHGMPGAWTRKVYGPTVLRSIAQAVEMEIPMQERLGSIAEHFSVRHVRRRVDKVAAVLKQGGCWIEELRRQRIVSRNDAALMKSAQELGNLPWAINEIADRQTRHLNHRITTLIEWLSPIPTVLFGIVIGLFAAAITLPMSVLIQELSL